MNKVMMLEKELIEVKILPQNRFKYEDALGKVLSNGEIIKIQQRHILPTSRTKVKCRCDLCGETFYRARKDIKESTLCGVDCRNKFLTEVNPSLNIDLIAVSCHICKKDFKVPPSKYNKQDVFFCSNSCYGTHRSKNYNGEKMYNYQSIKVPCANCDKNFKTSQWYVDNKKHLFCSQGCYWEFRGEHFREFYYDPHMRTHAKETFPEKTVREWLEDKGLKYKQEVGFLRKYYVDFYLPDYKTIIEVNGDYWHVNPEVYDVNNNDKTKKPLNEYQINTLNSGYERNRIDELENSGYKVCVLWEKDIYQDIDELMNSIFTEIKSIKQ